MLEDVPVEKDEPESKQFKACKAGEKDAEAFLEAMRGIFHLESLIRIHNLDTDKSPKARENYSVPEAEKLFAAANPEEYLADVIERMLDHPASRLEEFISQNWVKLRKSTNADR